MRNFLHGLEPVIGVSKLCHYQCIVGIPRIVGILKPMLISSKLELDVNRMVEALAQMSTVEM